MTVQVERPSVQWRSLTVAGVAAIACVHQIFLLAPQKAPLFLVGLGLGISLYHAAFGFTGAYRALFRERDLSGIAAQAVMLIAAMILFAPVLDAGTTSGRGVGGAVAPVGLAMILGALIFGIGMQLGGGCGSGTLFSLGGGSSRMVITLLFFCIGGFWASLHLAEWRQLPELPGLALGDFLGAGPAVLLQAGLLIALYAVLRSLGFRERQSLWWQGGLSLARLIRGPWPLLFSGLLLAFFNWLTLLLAGHPWTITWAFTLWGAKAARAIGWDPATSGFWTGGFQERALNAPVLSDTTSLMNLGIVLGALAAAALAGRLKPDPRVLLGPAVAAALGGLLLGYGARLAYGCNIGAFFSGVASTSLHGWAWIVAALAGNWIGIRLRPFFALRP